jgi:hypothetical protein
MLDRGRCFDVDVLVWCTAWIARFSFSFREPLKFSDDLVSLVKLVSQLALDGVSLYRPDIVA